MNTKKKLLSGLLAVMLLAGASVQSLPVLSELSSPLPVSADNYNGLEYRNDDGSIFITGYSGSETEITVPAEIDGCPVVAVSGNAFENNTGLVGVTFSEGLYSLGDSAFAGCTSLEYVNLPDELMNINMWTFQSCISLKEITIPDSVWSIGRYAFDSCTSLEKVNVPARVWDVYPDSFNRCQSLKSIDVAPDNANACSINGMLFNKAGTELRKAPGGLTEAVIPEGTETIAADAFRDSPKLSDVTLPDTVTKIDKYAFYDCPALTSLTVPATVTEIGDNAIGFYYDYKTLVKTPVSGFVMYCYSGSAAHEYAVAENLDYVLIDAAGLTVKVTPLVKAGTELPGDGYTYVRFTDTDYVPQEVNLCIESEYSFPKGGLLLDAGTYIAVADREGFAQAETEFDLDPDGFSLVNILLVQFGDVNADGSVNMKDLVLLQRWLNGWTVEINKGAANMTEASVSIADRLKNGINKTVNMRDYVALQRFLNGWKA